MKNQVAPAMGWPRREAPSEQRADSPLARCAHQRFSRRAGAHKCGQRIAHQFPFVRAEQLQELQQLFAGAGQMLGDEVVALVCGNDTRAATVCLVFFAAYQATFEQPIAQPGDRGWGDAQGLCQRTWQLRTLVVEQMQQAQLRHAEVEAQPGGQGGGTQATEVGLVQVDERVQAWVVG